MKHPPAFTGEKNFLNAVIETPQRSVNKYVYDQEGDFFKLKKTLPAGTFFPFDFGFIPHTIAEDGDPLDIMVLMDSPSFPGCIVECRCIGIIEVEQKEKNKKKVRNDRIIAVANESVLHAHLKTIKDMDKKLLNNIISFFEYYNEMSEKNIVVKAIKPAADALRLIKKHLIK